MKLTVASEYGCLALLTIAQRQPDWCKRQTISDRYGIPVSYLEQILHKFTTAGLVVSRRGADGGFRLARKASEISVADIVRNMDGALAPVRSVSQNFYQSSPIEASGAFRDLFRQVRDAVADILENHTLEDIVENERRAGTTTHTHRNGPTARKPPRRTGTRERSPSPVRR